MLQRISNVRCYVLFRISGVNMWTSFVGRSVGNGRLLIKYFFPYLVDSYFALSNYSRLVLISF
jgi:hypothetical protein